jgi:hypothetical protein
LNYQFSKRAVIKEYVTMANIIFYLKLDVVAKRDGIAYLNVMKWKRETESQLSYIKVSVKKAQRC